VSCSEHTAVNPHQKEIAPAAAMGLVRDQRHDHNQTKYGDDHRNDVFGQVTVANHAGNECGRVEAIGG
jgi:hypothetical protein